MSGPGVWWGWGCKQRCSGCRAASAVSPAASSAPLVEAHPAADGCQEERPAPRLRHEALHQGAAHAAAAAGAGARGRATGQGGRWAAGGRQASTGVINAWDRAGLAANACREEESCLHAVATHRSSSTTTRDASSIAAPPLSGLTCPMPTTLLPPPGAARSATVKRLGSRPCVGAGTMAGPGACLGGTLLLSRGSLPMRLHSAANFELPAAAAHAGMQ